ncbi:hypothetical protein [Fodinicola feengrottensis]|uniref:hypothetical protein n=1 Tax=Fodinicola feengrottensis TaxID=435914 RepID=UPI0013D6B26D|nr:hypothetical protein [Fodinicola feengrottensis]
MDSEFPPGVGVYELAPDLPLVEPLLDELTDRYPAADDPQLLAGRCRQLAYRRLPADLVATLTRFRDAEHVPVLAVAGLPVDDTRIGPTPDHWAAQRDPASTVREEIWFLLLAAVIGDPFGWATLQSGRLVQNVLPIKNQEHEQSGHGSLTTLAWHTPRTFHPYRCDYLGLFSRCATTISCRPRSHRWTPYDWTRVIARCWRSRGS